MIFSRTALLSSGEVKTNIVETHHAD